MLQKLSCTHLQQWFGIILVVCLNIASSTGLHASPQLLPSITPLLAVASDPLLPDFTVYTQVKEKKSTFFDFILTFVTQENLRISQLRASLQSLQPQADSLSPSQQQWLQQLAVFYRADKAGLNNQQLIERLLPRVDMIPASLALVQAANESAWGTSRFALKGNNLFGQWCFKKGCGIIPKSRTAGASHEVAKFSSPRQSVERYMHNLNNHRAYADLRAIRARLREQQKTLTGKALAAGLINYSGRREAYVKELRQMISFNKLGRYDVVADEVASNAN